MSKAFARFVERRGEDWTYQLWSYGSVNAYNRKALTLGSAVDIKAIRTETSKERVVVDVQGQERTLDITLLIKDSVDFSDIEDTTKKSPIFTSPSGIKYEGIALGLEGNVIGFQRVFLSKQRAS